MEDSMEVYSNETLSNITYLLNEFEDRLSDWQRSQLDEIRTLEGIQCYLKMWFNYSYNELEDGSYCNATWDNVYCWPPIPSGSKITQLCSVTFRYAQPLYARYLEGDAIRECTENGTWSQGIKSNYDECANSFEAYATRTQEKRDTVILVQYMLFFGSILSLLCLSISLIIYYKYRCLWCDRTIVHSHLMVALVLRFILLFIIAEPHVLKRRSRYNELSIICRSIIVIYLFATVASVSWMFIQGLYLNSKLTTQVFSTENRVHFRVYYFIGWAVPAGLTLVYLLFMMFSDQQDKCWKGYADMTEIWILLGPMIFALSINAMFLFNILRIVLEKVRNTNSPSESSQIVAAAKATLMLFPVLGINNLLLLYNPGGDYEKYYVTLNTFFGSTQGIFVAIVYCFNNGEVHEAIRRSINRVIARRGENFVSTRAYSGHRNHGDSGTVMMMVEIPQQNNDADGESVQQSSV